MSGIEKLYLFSGSFVCLAGVAMMAAYSLSTAWWRSPTGRMLATYAVAETGMSAIFLASVALGLSPVWFRYAWVCLQFAVGGVLWYQTIMIVRLNRQSRDA